MSVKLWLVRHGQTDWNVQGRFQGQADPPLNAAGVAQAEDLAARLAGETFDAIFSSDLRRALQTADILARAWQLQVTLDARLREVHHGAWDGLLVTEIRERYADAWGARQREPTLARPPGGETVVEVAARVALALDAIAGAHVGGAVLVVSHGLALATAVCLAQGIDLQGVYELIPENAVPKVITWTSGTG